MYTLYEKIDLPIFLSHLDLCSASVCSIGAEFELCRVSRSMTLFPNNFISVRTVNIPNDSTVALEPRTDSKVFASSNWPQVQIVKVVDREIRLLNTTDEPIFIPKNEQLCQIRATQIVDTKNLPTNNLSSMKQKPTDILPPF